MLSFKHILKFDLYSTHAHMLMLCVMKQVGRESKLGMVRRGAECHFWTRYIHSIRNSVKLHWPLRLPQTELVNSQL